MTSETLSSRIYQYIKDAIVKNKIKPKARIPEKEIANLFKSSTTPVREAILRLAAEGYIEMSPNRYAVVREISFEEYLDLQEALILLDTYACMQASRDMGHEDIQRLKDKTAEMGKYCSKETVNKFLEINYEIHDSILLTIRNKYLCSLATRVWEEYKQIFHRVLRSQYVIHSEYFKRFLKLHKELIKAIEAKDIPRLRRVIKNHWVTFP